MRDFIFGPARVRLAILGPALAAGVALALHAGVAPVIAQQIPKSLEEGGPDDAGRKQQTNWVVSVAGGAGEDVSMRWADELGRVLNDGEDLRVLPIIARGPVGNVEDLLYLNEVDIAVTQADVLEYFRTERKTALANRIQYITRLPSAQLHVAARENVHALEDLRGQKVVLGPAGGPAAVTGTVLFRRLGIAIKPIFTDMESGLDLVAHGDATALLTVEPEPSDFLRNVPLSAGIHLVSAPHSAALDDLYSSGELTSADYPNLISPVEHVETIAVPGVLAVQNLPKNDDRFRRVLRFVQYLYARWDWLGDSRFHPGWRDVSLTADIAGWTRFSPSEVFRQFILWREQRKEQ